MKNIVKYLQWLEEEFAKHPWLECLIKATSWADPDFDHQSVDEAFKGIQFAAFDMYQDTFNDIPIEDRESDEKHFLQMLNEDKDTVLLIIRIFNV